MQYDKTDQMNFSDEFKTFDTFSEALGFIYRKYGAEILLGKKLSAYLADYAPDISVNERQLIKSFYERGISDLLRKALNGSEDDKLEAVKKSVSILTDSFIDKKIAERTVYEFVSVLGWISICKNDTFGISEQNKSDKYDLINDGGPEEKSSKVSVDKPSADFNKLISDTENRNSPEAQFNIGNSYYEGNGVLQDYYEAVKWFRKAAEQNHAGAQNKLGECYFNGRGVEQDGAEAVKWYQLAADKGNDSGQRGLAYCYYTGSGIEKNREKAVEWYIKAAEQGNVKAQNSLAKCYYNGKGCEQDYSEAVKWFRMAANAGNDIAQYYLGICYNYGNGVSKNYIEAIKWYELAAEQGNQLAVERLEILRKTHKIGILADAAKGIGAAGKAFLDTFK